MARVRNSEGPHASVWWGARETQKRLLGLSSNRSAANRPEDEQELIDMPRAARAGPSTRIDVEQSPPSLRVPSPESPISSLYFGGRTTPAEGTTRPPSYRTRSVNQDDIEARAADATMRSGTTPSIPASTATARGSNITPSEAGNPHLKKIHAIYCTFGVIQLCIFGFASIDLWRAEHGNDARSLWTHNRQYVPLLVSMLTFGVYWPVALITAVLRCPSESLRRRLGFTRQDNMMGLTEREWRLVGEIWFPILLACWAAIVYMALPWLRHGQI